MNINISRWHISVVELWNRLKLIWWLISSARWWWLRFMAAEINVNSSILSCTHYLCEVCGLLLMIILSIMLKHHRTAEDEQENTKQLHKSPSVWRRIVFCSLYLSFWPFARFSSPYSVPRIPWAFAMAEACGVILCSIWLLVLLLHKHR